jgi:hypothetical protein
LAESMTNPGPNADAWITPWYEEVADLCIRSHACVRIGSTSLELQGFWSNKSHACVSQ